MCACARAYIHTRTPYTCDSSYPNTPCPPFPPHSLSIPQDSIADAGDELTYRALPFETFEHWYALSESVAHYQRGRDLRIQGHGFRAGAFTGAPYLCVFTSLDGNYSRTAPAAVASKGNTYSSTQLLCASPTWDWPDGRSRLSIRTSPSISTVSTRLAETAGFGQFFNFLDVPEWTSNTSRSRVLIDGVLCNESRYHFEAFGGRAPLRLTMEYTALRPKESQAFLHDVDADAGMYGIPTLLLVTDSMQPVVFNDALLLDSQLDGGAYSVGAAVHSLRLPLQRPATKQAKPLVQWDRESDSWVTAPQPIGIPDNVASPSSLSFETVADLSENSVRGVLTWNISQGWEGYAYKFCITARQVPVARNIREHELFARRCVYVVVPKCRRCFSSLDNLDTIAKLYDAKWLDVWSVNHALIRTTQVDLSSDEAFNTAKDQSYLLVEKAHAIKLGVAYKMASTDHLTTVATRFGMRLSSLMALNPDIVAANQDSNFVGKQVPH